MQCNESNCKRNAIATGRFCTECFQTKWGPNPIEYLPLPSCLTRIVQEYFAFTNVDYANNWELLYLTSQVCSESQLAFLFTAALAFRLSDMRAIDFIADRYCRCAEFWKHVCQWASDPYESIMANSLNVARVFEPFHPVVLTLRLLYQIVGHQQDDTMLWWIVNLPNIEIPLMNATINFQLFTRIIDWKSQRLLQRFIEMGLFSNMTIADRFLQTAIERHALPMFVDVWNIHYKDIFLPEHSWLLDTALDQCSFQILDFFSALHGATAVLSTSDLYILIRRLNSNTKFRSWIIRNKHMAHPDLAFRSDMDSVCFLELYDAGLFGTVSSESLTNMILLRRDIDTLVRNHQLNVSQVQPRLLALLSRMTHLGTEDQLQTTVRLMCKCLSLSEFQVMYTVPIVEKHLTFATLRRARADFFSLMVANGFDLATLDWFATMHDNEQQALLLRDVYAKNKALLRFARKTDNTQLQDWIAKFIQGKNFFLKGT